MTGGAAKAEMLARIRGALGAGAAVPDVPRGYRAAGSVSRDGAVERFCERVAEYRATVHRAEPGEVEDVVRAALGAVKRVAVSPGVADLGLGATVDEPPLSIADLDALDAVVTGSALAIAETGTIVLDGGALSGRRALTLVPDHHVCIVRAQTIVPSVPDAVAALAEAAAEGRPITLVSGPSATSDIELDRVEGVHGPRNLDVVVAL